MKKYRNLKHKIIVYVMSVSIFLSVLITAIMAVGSVRSTNEILLDNMQITARIAAQNISSNLHLLTERIFNLSYEDLFADPFASPEEKTALMDETELLIEFVWLAAYDSSGNKLYGDEIAPSSIADTKDFSYMTQTGSIVIGEPYRENGILQLRVGTALQLESQTPVYLVGSYKYDILNDVLSLLILGDTGSARILNENGTIIGDRALENVAAMQDIYSLYPSERNSETFDKVLSYQTGSALLRLGHSQDYVGYSPIPGTNWSVFINVPQQEYMDSLLLSLIVSVLLAILLLLLAAAVITPLAQKISRSLGTATKRLQALSEGNLTEAVIPSESNDETAVLTSALADTLASLNRYIKNIQSCLGALSAGDYTVQIPDDFCGDFSSIHDSLCNITRSLNQTMQRMNQSSVDVNRNSSGVSSHARQLYDGSVNQSALLEQLVESISSITVSIGHTKANASEIEACSDNAEEKTALGAGYMQNLLDTIQQIRSAVQEISKISQMIESISDETSLLSLNASIEAARAGNAGKGFAVVASQIGNLAGQTADALRQTMLIIERSTNAIQEGAETADRTARAFEQIQAVTEQYHDISKKLSDTVKEQTIAVNAINQQLDSLQQIANANRSLAEQTDRMAADSLAQSESLKDYVAQVKIRETI
ncbi:MAG: methyl-accepting chemotaxis protein [Lachnospiraceae bacterium]|nr:methyl-accepting chemotaxis protein [Lachnospiraceae bacterium]